MVGMRTAGLLWTIALSAALGTAHSQASLRCGPFGEPPAPMPRTYKGAVDRGQTINEEVMTTPYRVLFLGDSLTERWDPEIWERHYAVRGALNAGVSGDRTENLLWRLENGNLDGPPPEVVVLLIGTNDLGLERTPQETAEGIRAILAVLKSRLPNARILLLGIWPRALAPFRPLRLAIAEVNRLIRGCADGASIQYLDLGDALLDPDGRLSPAVSPDRLHLSALGYARIAPRLDRALDRLLETRR
jgi:beta-glucosidase